MNTSDNIAAPATAIGGAVTVIRLSGPGVLAIANSVWHGRKALGDTDVRRMLLGKVGDDPTLAVYMKGPASYTGDDVVELQCHGGAAAADAVLNAVLNAGCRLAEPGEFTCRAFINGKLDLLQAEAVSDLVSSGSRAALKLAENQLAGKLSAGINALWDKIADLRSECESRLDFPDEELDFDNEVPQKIESLITEVDELLSTRRSGAALRDGIAVVLAGRPNAGKSSLLNTLLGCERAIVSPIPGTTRDTVDAQAVLRGIPVHLTDTAGLRESADPIEQQGVARSRRTIAGGEVTFWLLDASAADPAAELSEIDTAAPGLIAVWNKCDLVPGRALPELSVPCVRISALKGTGLEALLDAFEKKVFQRERAALPEVAVNARSGALLEKAQQNLVRAAEQFKFGDYELAAMELAGANTAIGEIVGKTVSPDLLGKIFHRFCLGK